MAANPKPLHLLPKNTLKIRVQSTVLANTKIITGCVDLSGSRKGPVTSGPYKTFTFSFTKFLSLLAEYRQEGGSQASPNQDEDNEMVGLILRLEDDT